MRRVRILAYPQVNLLDVAGPVQVLASASQYAMGLGVSVGAVYDIETVSLDGGAVLTSTGVSLMTARAEPSGIDTLLVAGGHGAETACADSALLDYVRKQSALAQRTGSICTGAFILAAAGLLDGRRAATHWAYCDDLAKRFPKLKVESDVLYVEDAPLWTSAGVMAGIDLALALVERDLGASHAHYTARAIVAPARRVGGESQISSRLHADQAETSRLRKLMEWIAANPRADLSVSALAERACVSTRSLQRHFATLGQTPAAYVESVRIETAKRLLVRTSETIERVAMIAGFPSSNSMQRAFIRAQGATPAKYRQSVTGS